MAETLSDLIKAEYRTAFQTFDSNKDGKINEEDLEKLMNYLKFNPTKEDIKNMIEEFHKDRYVNERNSKNSKNEGLEIEFDDFLDIVAKKMFDGNAENDLLQAFKIFDVENKGTIKSSTLKKSLMEIDKDITMDELDNLLHEWKDGDAEINYTKIVREFLSS